MDILTGSFKYLSFSPLFGEDFQFDGHIFQMGWFNHQPTRSSYYGYINPPIGLVNLSLSSPGRPGSLPPPLAAPPAAAAPLARRNVKPAKEQVEAGEQRWKQMDFGRIMRNDGLMYHG